MIEQDDHLLSGTAILPDEITSDEVNIIESACKKVVSGFGIVCGLIVVAVENNDLLLYWHAGGYYTAFDQDDETEYPKIYRKYKYAKLKANLLNETEAGRNICWHVALYFPTDIELKPLEKYVKMDGGQFPGCPRK